MQTMNKTVFPLVMAVLTACPVLFSCTEKEQEVPVENKIYEYRFELAGDDTRAYFNDDGVFWELNDHVGLFTPTESLEAAVNTDASPKTIDVQSSTSLKVGTKVYAYYPYVDGNTSVSASKVLFPAEQSGGSISAMPLAGIPAEVVTEGEYNGVIRFLNLGSVIDFRVFSLTYAGETVESVTLQAGENSNIAGTATIDLTAVSWNDETETATIPPLNWAEGAGSTTVTLTQSAPVAADKDAAIADGNLYMVVAPGTYSGTITVTTNAARYTFPITNQTFKQNGLKRFNMNLDSDSAVREAFSKTYGYVSSISEGTYLICGSETKELSVALFPNVNTEGWSNDPNRQAIPHIIIGDDTSIQTITRDDAEVICSEVELIGAEGKFKIKSVKTGQYLMVPNSNYVIAFTEEESNATVFDINSNSVKSGDYYFYHSGSAHGFTFRARSATNLRFYKLGGSTLSQTLKFSETAFTYDLASGEPFVEPTLTGAKTTVTYDSSDKTVAKVDADGTVHPLSVGTTTITATATGTAEYQGATASYELTVINSNVPKYVKAEEMENGVQYLIVSGNHVLRNNNNFVGANEVVVENEVIYYDAPATDLWTAVTDGSAYNLTNNNRYLRLSNNSLSISSSKSGTSSNNLWSYDASKNYLRINSRYLYYTNNGFTTSSSAHNAALYVLDDGQPKDQHLSFSKDVVTFNIYGKETPVALTGAPTLSGAKTDVSYASDNEAVATVDPSTGEVSIQGVGEAKITATAVATEKYLEGTAFYTITVINEAVPYYTKVNSVSELPSETSETGNYIYVYEDGDKAYVFKPIVDGTPTGNGKASSGHVELTKTGSAVEVALTASGIAATDDVVACKVQLSHHSSKEAWNTYAVEAGWWIRINNDSSNGLRILAMTSGGYSSNFEFSGTGNNLTVSRTESNSSMTAYLSYNATSGVFEAVASSTTISLYQLSE